MSISLANGSIHAAAGDIAIRANLRGSAFTKTGKGMLNGTHSHTGSTTISAGTFASISGPIAASWMAPAAVP